jgi:hypothetical protein
MPNARTDTGIKNNANSNIGCKLLMTAEGPTLCYIKVMFPAWMAHICSLIHN